VGLRRLLTRQPAKAEDPVERLAELGREQADHHPTRPFAEPATQDAAAPIPAVAVEKKERPVFRRVGRRAPSYVWLSQRSREVRATSVKSFIDQQF
jgi:hypothetical protein